MKKIIIANWKANPERIADARTIFRGIKKTSGRCRHVKTVVCPPAVYLDELTHTHGICAIGAQDVFWGGAGAHTGQITPGMVKKLGAEYVILGHSETRELGDTNEIVNRKIQAALEYRLYIILCVGEKIRDDEGEYLTFIEKEVEESLAKVSKDLYKNIIVAYEPIWAIGKSDKYSDTPQDFIEKAIFIRKTLAKMTSKDIAMKVPIIYGGSIGANNAKDFLVEGKASGLLVGHNSLDPKVMSEILLIANES